MNNPINGLYRCQSLPRKISWENGIDISLHFISSSRVTQQWVTHCMTVKPYRVGSFSNISGLKNKYTKQEVLLAQPCLSIYIISNYSSLWIIIWRIHTNMNLHLNPWFLGDTIAESTKVRSLLKLLAIHYEADIAICYTMACLR